MSRIQLYNCNAMELLAQTSNDTIDLIITDPPYKINTYGSLGTAGGMFKKDITKKGKVFIHNSIDCTEYAAEFYRVLKDGSHCYIMTNHVNLLHMLNTFTSVGFKFTKSLIWNKSNKIMGRFYMSQFEYILFFRKGRAVKINNCSTSDILNVPNKKTKNAQGENIHDTEKPVELMKILVENSSKENQIVADYFFGYGSTALACKLTNRQFIGSEIDIKYYTLTKERIGFESE